MLIASRHLRSTLVNLHRLKHLSLGSSSTRRQDQFSKKNNSKMMAVIGESNEEGENVAESNNTVNYAHSVAEIPEWRGNHNPTKDYPDIEDDVRMWTPIKERDERCMHLFMYLARSALTYAQVHQGIPDNEAMENSCSDYAEQYISDVLHDSGYLTKAALRTLMTKEIPHKVSDRWTAIEMNLFEQGLMQYRKNFAAIKSNLLPHKATMDIVEFYYTWKRTKQVKGLAASRARAFLRRRNKPKSPIICSPVVSSIVTRGQLMAKTNSGTPVRVTVSRKDVFTRVKRRRKSTDKPRIPSIEHSGKLVLKMYQGL